MRPVQTRSETASRVHAAVNRVVNAFEVMSEFKVARDRIGDKHYHRARMELTSALLAFAREIIRAAWFTERGGGHRA